MRDDPIEFGDEQLPPPLTGNFAQGDVPARDGRGEISAMTVVHAVHDARETLARVFGFPAFRGEQERVVARVLAGG